MSRYAGRGRGLGWGRGRGRSGVRPRVLVGLALAGSLALAGCSGEEPDATEEEPAAQEPAVTVEPTLVSPLTGLPVEGRAPRHPVVAVKVDNSGSSAPQVGLGAADMVVEELVEGGITRLAVFYWTDVPEVVGPVRSMRATDIGIVQPLDAVLVASGGAPQTVNRVKAAGISTYTEGADAFYRDTGRSAPYNLFLALDDLVRDLPAADQQPPTYLPFGDAFPRGRRATGFTATFSPSSSTSFEFRGGRYVHTDTYAGAGDDFAPRTVLVLRVPVGDAGYLDPSGSTVPETRFTGRGQATVFHGGRVVHGRWVKEGLGATVELVTRRGSTLELPAGKVRIELIPADGGSLAVRR